MMQRPAFARSIIAFIVTAFLAIAFANTADARRFGGGSSLGNQGQSNQQATPQRQGSQQAERSGNRAAGMGAGGLIAGMAAGGLLAWMFMGGAFEGFQFFDFLVIMLLGLGIFMLIRHFRQNQAVQSNAGTNPAGHSSGSDNNVLSMPQQRAAHGQQGTPAPQARPGSLLASFDFGGGSNSYQPPAWFDESRFLQAAKGHFDHLQKAWDNNEMTEIFDYVTPEMYKELLRVRSDLGNQNETEVVSLDAELEDLGEQDNNIIAQVRFTGQIREEGMTNRFDETWIVQRDLDKDDANWLIAGIRQN